MRKLHLLRPPIFRRGRRIPSPASTRTSPFHEMAVPGLPSNSGTFVITGRRHTPSSKKNRESEKAVGPRGRVSARASSGPRRMLDLPTPDPNCARPSNDDDDPNIFQAIYSTAGRDHGARGRPFWRAVSLSAGRQPLLGLSCRTDRDSARPAPATLVLFMHVRARRFASVDDGHNV